MATTAVAVSDPTLVSSTSQCQVDIPPRDFLDLTGDSHDEHSIELLREILRTSRKIVVVAGAGISVAAGIPDFRGAKGMFSRMKSKGRSGQMMFDMSVYRSPETIEDFHEMIGNLYDASKRTEPTPFHKLLERLAKTNRLLRLYTQNIDFLDTRHETLKTVVPVPAVGPWPKTIAVHGSLEKMTCTKCKVVKDFNPELFRIWKEDTPECIDCKKDEDARVAAGRRKLGVGFIRPRMVLYGEPGFDALNIGSCMASDLRNRPDALIVVGTTLKIPGTRTMVKEMSKAIGNRGHIIWLNMDDAPGGEFEDVWDFVIKGDCQKVAELMQDIPIHPKDQSFVFEEPLSASQSTQADLSTENYNGEFWKVVNGPSNGRSLGLLTPAPSLPSSSDDEKSIKSQLLLKQGNLINLTTKKGTKIIPQTSTTTFYAPLATKKTLNPLKRKRAQTSRASSQDKAVIKDSTPDPIKLHSTSKVKPLKPPKTAKIPTIRQKKSKKASLVVKLKISPSNNRITQDVYTQTINDAETTGMQSPVASDSTTTLDDSSQQLQIIDTEISTNHNHQTQSPLEIPPISHQERTLDIPPSTERRVINDIESSALSTSNATIPSLETEVTLADEPTVSHESETSTTQALPESLERAETDALKSSGKRINKWMTLERRKSSRISASRSDST